MTDRCPVCLNAAERGRDRDYGDKKRIRCFRCGPFEISGTALSMLGNRVDQDPLVRARLSHAIRSNTSEDNCFFVSSANLDELVEQSLPGVSQQLIHLTLWLAAKLGDDRFGRVAYPLPEILAGMIGTADGKGVQRLIDYAVKQAIVEFDANKNVLGLSPKGWSMIEPPKTRDEPMPQTAAVETAVDIVKAKCNECSGERNAYTRASHTTNGEDGEVSWSDTYDILECCGCNSLSVRHSLWFSEWDDIGTDPRTGQPRLIPGVKVTYWPARTKRNRPGWAANLSDDVLRDVFDEVYKALNSDLIVLASIGTRTLLDRAMFLRVGDPKDGFAGKLDLMVKNGHIGTNERAILEAVPDAGNSAAHRGFAPNEKTLGTIIDAVENFLNREFILKTAAGDVRKATPSRQNQKRSP